MCRPDVRAAPDAFGARAAASASLRRACWEPRAYAAKSPRGTIRAFFRGVHVRVAGPYDRANVALAERPLVFGRDPRCDVVLEDPAVAPRHAVVQRTPMGVEVVDLGPPGGLRLDGTTVRRGIVGPGHAVVVGATTLTFDVRDELARPAYVPAAPPAPPRKKSGAGAAVAIALVLVVGLGAAGGFVAWRRYGEAAPTTSASAPASSPRGAPSASAVTSASSRPAAARASASGSSRPAAPNATAGIEPLVFDRNPFAGD